MYTVSLLNLSGTAATVTVGANGSDQGTVTIDNGKSAEFAAEYVKIAGDTYPLESQSRFIIGTAEIVQAGPERDAGVEALKFWIPALLIYLAVVRIFT